MNDQLIRKTVSRNIKFSSARKLVSSFLEKTRPHQGTVRCAFLLALAFFALASSGAAQPAMSRGEQLLPISYNECIQRAEQAYLAEGWVNIGKGGAFVNAFKENNGAYIMCNVAPENKIWVNIVVASNSGDGNVPGAERVKLQTRMGQSGSVGSAGCGLGTRWEVNDGGWPGVWTRRGTSSVFDGLWNKEGQFTALLTISINGNRVNVSRRYATLGGDCELKDGILDPDGVTVTGTTVCTHGSGAFYAKIKCGP